MKSKNLGTLLKQPVSVAVLGSVVVLGAPNSANAYYEVQAVTEKADDTRDTSLRDEMRRLTKGIKFGSGLSRRFALSPRVDGSSLDGTGNEYARTGTGVNAGDEPQKFLGLFENVWASGDKSFIESNPWERKQLKSESEGLTLSFGMDASINDQWIAGMAFAQSTSDSFTSTNNLGQYIDQSTKTYSVVPYLAYLLDDNYYISGTFGISRTAIRNHILNSAKQEQGNAYYATKNYFASVEGNYLNNYNGVDFQAAAGLTYSNSHQQSYTDSTGTRHLQTNTVLWSTYTSVQATYPEFASYRDLGIVPMARMSLEYDPGLKGIGDLGLRATGGVSKIINDRIYLGFEANHMFRDNQTENGLMVNVNIAF